MLRRKSLILSLFALTATVGCGGGYSITVPDQIATPGGNAAAVVRLQQYEFASVKRSIDNAAIRFKIADGPQRATFTDELGFAAANVPVPSKPGRFDLRISIQDPDGDEAVTTVPTYVWNRKSPVIAVDLDSLPTSGDSASGAACDALISLSKRFNILYLTKLDPWRKAEARSLIDQCAYPDGPVIVWDRKYCHWARMGKLKLPTRVVEAHLTSTISDIRNIFPELHIGLTASADSFELFKCAGLKSVVIGADVPADAATRFDHWAAFALEGLGE